MPEIRFLRPLVRAPELSTNIYRCKAPGVTEAKVLQTAKMFGLQGEKRAGELRSTEKFLAYREGPLVVSLCKLSGALRYIDSSRWQRDDGVADLKFADHKAVELATAFLREKNLFNPAESKLLKVTHLRVGTVKIGTGEGEERVIDAGVVFQRQIDGVPVEGPGGRVVVFLDHEGQVTGCDRVWREIDEVHRPMPFGSLQPPEFAENNLRRYWRSSLLEDIEVEEGRFSYFELGKGQKQNYLQPVYVFPLRLISDQGRIVMKSVHVVPAAERPVGRLMPQPKVSLPQTVRRE